MSKEKFTLDGVEYTSRSAAARKLLKTKDADGKPLTCSAVAKIVGMSAQTVYTQTDEGIAKVTGRRMGYRAVHLAKTGNYTAQMVCDRVKIDRAILNKLLIKNSITCPNAKDLAQREKSKANEKAENAQATKDAEKATQVPATAEKNVKPKAKATGKKKETAKKK